jgi:hypothetical protein
LTHQAKAPSAGSTQATGDSRGLFRRAFATRGASRGSKGSGAPSSRRLHAVLAVLALSIAASAITAVPASAADPSPQMGTISEVSYTTAKVSGTITSDGSGGGGQTAYAFQYSKDPGTEGWSTGYQTEFFGGLTGAVTNAPVNAKITLPKAGTEYFVRLVANNGISFGGGTQVPSPEPNPSFTTLAVDPPTIPGAVEASNVFSLSAKATAKVKRPANADPAFDVKCRFEYITDAQFLANEGNTEPGFTGAQTADCAENPITKDSVDLQSEQAVSAALTGLEPATAYHLRLIAENAAPGVVTKVGSNFTTTAKVAAPSVTATDNASEVTYSSAKFTGKVQRPAGEDPALDVNCRFEYVTQVQFEAEEFAAAAPNGQIAGCEQNPITADKVDAGGEMEVSANAGLVANTTYHLRLVAENASGSDAKVALATFTTPEADKPTVTIDPVAGGTFTTAHVTGTVEADDPGVGTTLINVEISTDGVNWDRIEKEASSGAGLKVVAHDFTGLQPSTTYFFRISAYYDPGNPSYDLALAEGRMAFSSEPNPSITTELATPPSAENLQVTDVTATSAHFSGTVNPNAPAGPLSEAAKNAYESKWHFECTPECKDKNGNTIDGIVQGEEGPQPVAGDVKRLDPNTAYEVRLVVSSEGGEDTEAVTFPTPLIKPTLKAAPGGSDGKGGYTLQGIVNPNHSPVSDCKFEWGPNSADYAFTAPCSPAPGDKAQPVTVEAHLAGLNPGVVYHYNLLATNGAGTTESGDQEFIPTLDPPESCPNAQLRKENSSLALPECRAYEQVTPAGKEGSLKTLLASYSDSGDAVFYVSEAVNIAKSGQNQIVLNNNYVTTRSAAGWETIPNLNGSSGNFKGAPSYVDASALGGSIPVAYSPDFLSSLWISHRKGDPGTRNYYLRSPDGTLALIGRADGTASGRIDPSAVSADLSHFVVGPFFDGSANGQPTLFGLGVYEFIGTGVDVPRRVDVDNSGTPLTTCFGEDSAAKGHTISPDGREIVFTVPGDDCNAKSPDQQIWARVNGTTSFHVSASQCTRVDCNAPAAANFSGAAEDGSRVFFATTQQLLNGDTDQTNDIYACDIPAGSPAPIGDTANPCTSLIEVSGAATEAKVEPPLYTDLGALRDSSGVKSVSRDGSTVSFVAEGILATNDDALGEEAVAGDHNLYVWRTDAAHPTGHTSFVGRLGNSDVQGAQATPDGRYLVFTTANQLVSTDTDNARDVYRYDADTGTLTRASTNVFGVSGNGEGLDAALPSRAVSDDGQKITFTTTEALAASDGNGEPDAYLWTPARVSLISAGSVGGGVAFVGGHPDSVWINGSGRDIFFQTAGALTPADGDDLIDVYDARVGGGFSFAPKPICTGEACQAPASASPASTPTSPANRPNGEGNVRPKVCPKGKILKGEKCVKKKKKKHKKHSGKKHHGKKAAHKQGGGK